MVRFLRVLKAVASASNRGSKSLRQVRGNNMFYAGVTLLFMMDPVAMMFFLVIINLVLFLPSSGDPMGVVPRERLDLWPLSTYERRALRAISPLLNPIAWIVLALMAWKKVAWDLWAVVAGSFAAGFMGSWWVRSPRVWVPRLPGGALTQLVRKDLRQFLTALDLYCALLITIPAAYLRFTGELPADAHVPLTMLMVVTPSTMALSLFGLDGESGLTRYRLSPLAGWQIFASKSIAYLILTLVITAPLAPAAGLAGGCLALVGGHWHSAKHPTPQSRWRFRVSSGLGPSLVQMILAILGFGLVSQLGAIWLPLCIALCALSTGFTGWRFDRVGLLQDFVNLDVPLEHFSEKV
jgi:hypothetical protein